MENSTPRLSNQSILGYGVASITDAASYNFVIMYFVYFLTNVAGLSAASAGIIYTIAVIYDAVTNPFIGTISDNTRSKYGRRRPYLLAAAFPLGIALFLMFTPVELGQTGTFVYYLVVMMIYWTSYSVFYIPYTALGAEMTLDYNERTKLRAPATIFNLVGNIVGMSLPLAAVAFFMKRGASEGAGWNRLTLIIACVCIISLLISWRTTRGKELPKEAISDGQAEKENMFRTYAKVLKLKPFKWQVGIVIFFILGYSVINTGLTYYVLYCAGLTEAQMSTALLIYIVVGMFIVPGLTILSGKLGKKNALAFCFLFSAACLVVFRITGVHSFGALVLLLILFGVGNGAYWLLVPAIGYDLSEVYQYKYGERKEAQIMSLVVFIVKIASIIGVNFVTMILTLVGYDAANAVQPSNVISGISTGVLIIPAVGLAAAAVFAIFFPFDKARFDKLSKAIEDKNNGREVDEEGLERVI